MARTPKNTETGTESTMSEEKLNQADQRSQLALAGEHEREASAVTLAQQVGYEGAMTVGALEDEIRFYQRRSVEALLETGKRLLMLKALTIHGEFEQRVVLLGFSERTAQRFMQSALKTAKSANLALLSTQIKSASVFLELVTHDDDVIDNLVEMDDFERMSPSEVRAAARELAADNKAKDDVLAEKQATITKQQVQIKKKVAALTDWPDAFSPLFDQADGAHRQLEKCFSDIEIVTRTALSVEPAPGEEEGRDKAFAALAKKLGDTLGTADKVLADARKLYVNTLEAWVPAVQ